MPKPFLSEQSISRSCKLPDESRFEMVAGPGAPGRDDLADLGLWFSGRMVVVPLATLEDASNAIELLSNMESVVHDVLEFLHREALCFEPEKDITWAPVVFSGDGLVKEE